MSVSFWFCSKAIMVGQSRPTLTGLIKMYDLDDDYERAWIKI